MLSPTKKILFVCSVGFLSIFFSGIVSGGQTTEGPPFSIEQAIISENKNLAENSQTIAGENLRELETTVGAVKHDNYADLYRKIINKNKEILRLKKQLGLDTWKEENLKIPMSISLLKFFRSTFSDSLWYKKLYETDVNFWTLVSAILFLWLVSSSKLRRTKSNQSAKFSDNGDSSNSGLDESDLSSDFESRLDLARAFVATGEISQAQVILKGIITSGDASQRNEAKLMLESMSI